MAETHAHIPQTLAEQYALEKQEKPVVVTKPVEAEMDNVPSKEVVSEKAEEAPPAVEETPLVAPAVEESPVVTPSSEESSEATPPVAVEESSEPNPATEDSSEAAPEESSDSAENSGDQETAAETPEIKIETAPADFRFPTTNQTRHCFTRYVEYHRCIAAKGEEAPECDKFKKYYRSLCPGEWVERWNEQRENGTFPGPL